MTGSTFSDLGLDERAKARCQWHWQPLSTWRLEAGQASDSEGALTVWHGTCACILTVTAAHWQLQVVATAGHWLQPFKFSCHSG